MALTVKIGVAGSEVDLTAYLVDQSLRVEQRADSFVSTCSLQLIDKTASGGLAFTVKVKDSILVEDGATKYFAGTLANTDAGNLAEGPEALVYTIECQDYNLLVEEVVIDQLEEYGAQQDSAIIDDLFDKYLPEINSHTPGGAPAGYVQSLHVFAEIDFENITLREALDRIASEVESTALEGYWYIDYDKYLHYFNVEDNAPGWSLSDSPDNVSTFPYFSAVKRTQEGAAIVNRILVAGAEMALFVQDYDSYDYFGKWFEGIIRDNTLLTTSEIMDFGYSLLAKWAYPAETYEVTIRKTGLRAGINIQFDNSLFGTRTRTNHIINPSFEINATDGWTFFQGGAGGSAVADATRSSVGSKSCKITASNAGATDQRSDSIALANGATVTVQVRLYRVSAVTSDVRIRDATNNIHRATLTPTGTGRWEFLTGSWTNDTGGTVNVQLWVRNAAADGSSEVWFDACVVEIDKGPTAVEYIDGTLPYCSWSGAAHNSTSSRPSVFMVTQLTITWPENTPTFTLSLGGTVSPTALIKARLSDDGIRSGLGPVVVGQLPICSKGWSHDIVFSATDNDTVAWAVGTINTAAGDVFSIVVGNTGNMGAVSYIYLDTDTSLTVLQVSVTPAVGKNIILVAVAKPQAAGNDATFLVFGGEGQGVLVDTAQIVDDAITAAKTRIGLQGWSHNLVFSASDHDTVAWASGTIELADGTTYNITGANTGNIAAVTYIYLDTDVSVILLQTTTTVANAVGNNKVLIAVAENVAAGKDATFQTFGGEGLGVMITAGQIVANTITANEIAANTITANEILANTITANEIAANTVTAAEIFANTITANEIAVGTITTNEIAATTILAANIAANTITANEIAANTITAGQISAGTITATEIAAGTITANEIAANTITANKLSMGMGDQVFDVDNGLLLLGLGCPITPTSWTSLRGLVATISGAFHQGAGAFPETRGLVVELAVTNLFTNPSFETNTTGWATAGANIIARVTVQARYGSYSLKCTYQDSTNLGQYAITAPAAGSFVLTGWVWVPSDWDGGDLRLLTTGFAGGSHSIVEKWTAGDPTGTWVRMVTTVTLDAGDLTGTLYLHTSAAPTAGKFVYLDACQFEQRAFATTYCDGSLGTDYTWTGAAHASTSTRTVTQINLDAHAGLISSKNTLSFAVWAQMPYNWDEAGVGNTWYLFEARGADDNNRIRLEYRSDTNVFRLYLNGAIRITASEVQFSSGDWLHFVVTLDFSGDTYYLYVNGILVGSSTATLSNFTITNWILGAAYLGASGQSGFVFSEYAILDSVLTVGEDAALYALGKPLVDVGAHDKPGIYILDGRISIASATSGARLELEAESLAIGNPPPTYNSGTGVFLGLDSGIAKFFIGNSAGNKILWDGSTLSVTGTITIGNPGDIDGSTINNDGGWTDDTAADAAQVDATQALADAAGAQTAADAANAHRILGVSGTWTVTDADTITWTSIILRLGSGSDVNIINGNTGNMAAKTYIYYNGTTTLQTTTNPNVIGATHTLVAVAEDGADKANVQVVAGGIYMSGDWINAGSITAAKLTVASLSAITADMGSLTAGTITGGTIRTAASPAARIEMNTSWLAGYSDAATKQFYLDASSGKAYAGAGAVTLSVDGVTFAQGSGTVNKIRWLDGATSRAHVYAAVAASIPSLYIKAGPSSAAAYAAHVSIEADAHTGSSATIDMYSQCTGTACYINITVGGTGSTINIAAPATWFTGEILPVYDETDDIGSPSKAWFNIYYKNLVDVGCLGYFDEVGEVYLRSGESVSASEALSRIRQHPTKMTTYGTHRLDYATLPESVYRPAVATRDRYDHKGKLVARKGEPYGKEGAELGALVSIMIGAIQELTDRIKELER